MEATLSFGAASLALLGILRVRFLNPGFKAVSNVWLAAQVGAVVLTQALLCSMGDFTLNCSPTSRSLRSSAI